MTPGSAAAGLDAASASLAAVLALARAEARALGVTRLADVTGLDHLGLAVWQAVRPRGRALSVHQGKGLDAATAQLGALMEAIESSHAEAWRGPVTRCHHAELPPGQRTPRADDFAAGRGTALGEPLDWTPIKRLDGGGVLQVPAAAVSLDLTWSGPPGVERSSNGQAAGFDLGFATAKGLCEAIERDAVGAWLRGGVMARLADLVAVPTIRYDWFDALAARLAGRGVHVHVWRVPAIVALPVIAAQITDFGARERPHKRAAGTCAHADPEAALRGALLEALQSRLTGIAGARDDIRFDRAATVGGASIGLSVPPPPGWRGIDWAAVAAAPPRPVAGIIAELGRAGYGIVARALLSPPGAAVTTVKLFVPGLGSHRRQRREPLPA